MNNETGEPTTSVDRIVHTPGWTIEPHGKGYALYSGRGPIQHGMNLVYMSDPDSNWESTKRLIVAAPDLLRACELVELWMLGGKPGPHSDSAVLAQVRDAIHKAKTKVV